MPFASAVTYFQEHDLDLNHYLQPHPLSTYFLRMEGEALKDAGIHGGDILVVDRTRTAATNNLIIAEINGQLLARRFLVRNKQTLLGTDNPHQPPYLLHPEDTFAVWGVITSVIRKLL